MRAFCGAQSPPGAAPGAGRRQPDIDNPQCARGKQQNQIKTLNRYLCGPIFFLKPFFWHLQIIDLAPLDLLGPRPPPLIYGPLFLNLWEVRNNKITMTQPSCFPHPQSKIQEGGLFREKPYAATCTRRGLRFALQCAHPKMGSSLNFSSGPPGPPGLQ